MISWLQGQRVGNWQQGLRYGLTLDCGGGGYEGQLPRNVLDKLELDGDGKLTLWVHQVQRKDGDSLFGFCRCRDRDLFRSLIAVNGVGPQIAVALLEGATTDELIYAIMRKDIHRLCRANGVGKRTAERLVVELHSKLSSLSDLNANPLSKEKQVNDLGFDNLPFTEALDIRQTLESLGYRDPEISSAMRAASLKASTSACRNPEFLLHECLRWLSREPKEWCRNVDN